MITNILIRTFTLFGGIAVGKALNNIAPITKAAFQNDPIATIGMGLIQVAASDSVMQYLEGRIVNALDSIAAAQDQIAGQQAEAPMAPAAPAPVHHARKSDTPVQPAPKPAHKAVPAK